MHVFIVEYGMYSARRIIAVFSTEAQAQEVVAHLGDEADYQAWEVDTPVASIPPGQSHWTVWMELDGTLVDCVDSFDVLDPDDMLYPLRTTSYRNGTSLEVSCLASNRNAAIKIANEERIRVLLEEEQRKQTAPIIEHYKTMKIVKPHDYYEASET